jgi:hypothetical protein
MVVKVFGELDKPKIYTIMRDYGEKVNMLAQKVDSKSMKME